MPNVSIRATQAQIDHIKEHYGAFSELGTGFTDVEEYFRYFGHVTDLYERLCTILELTPISRDAKDSPKDSSSRTKEQK